MEKEKKRKIKKIGEGKKESRKEGRKIEKRNKKIK